MLGKIEGRRRRGRQRMRGLDGNGHESVLVAQSCRTLCDPMDCSPPGSSVHGISQARILEWVAMSCTRGSPQPRDRTQVSCTAGEFFTLGHEFEHTPGVGDGQGSLECCSPWDCRESDATEQLTDLLRETPLATKRDSRTPKTDPY